MSMEEQKLRWQTLKLSRDEVFNILGWLRSVRARLPTYSETQPVEPSRVLNSVKNSQRYQETPLGRRSKPLCLRISPA